MHIQPEQWSWSNFLVSLHFLWFLQGILEQMSLEMTEILKQPLMCQWGFRQCEKVRGPWHVQGTSSTEKLPTTHLVPRIQAARKGRLSFLRRTSCASKSSICLRFLPIIRWSGVQIFEQPENKWPCAVRKKDGLNLSHGMWASVSSCIQNWPIITLYRCV